MAWDAYEMGITPELGGMPSDDFYRDSDDNEPSYFATAQEAQAYAKANPGVIIVRAFDNEGFTIKKTKR